MPLPASQLNRMVSATLEVTRDEREPIELQAAPGASAPTPAWLRPEAWFVSAEDPLGEPTDAADNERLHRDLARALGQARLVSHPATLNSPGGAQRGYLLVGVTRSKAMRLAYKRKQWAVVGLFADRVEWVYTGLNSREKR